jgi:ribosomal protein L40E
MTDGKAPRKSRAPKPLPAEVARTCRHDDLSPWRKRPFGHGGEWRVCRTCGTREVRGAPTTD